MRQRSEPSGTDTQANRFTLTHGEAGPLETGGCVLSIIPSFLFPDVLLYIINGERARSAVPSQPWRIVGHRAMALHNVAMLQRRREWLTHRNNTICLTEWQRSAVIQNGFHSRHTLTHVGKAGVCRFISLGGAAAETLRHRRGWRWPFRWLMETSPLGWRLQSCLRSPYGSARRCRHGREEVHGLLRGPACTALLKATPQQQLALRGFRTIVFRKHQSDLQQQWTPAAWATTPGGRGARRGGEMAFFYLIPPSESWPNIALLSVSSVSSPRSSPEDDVYLWYNRTLVYIETGSIIQR